MSCCAVGRRHDAPDIAVALRAGATLGDVSKRFHVPKASLGRHKAGCLKIVSGLSQEVGTGAKTAEAESRARMKPLDNSANDANARSPAEGGPEPPLAAPSQDRPNPVSGAVSPFDDGVIEHGERPSSKEERVSRIMRMMAQFRWVPETGDLVAVAWGLSRSTVGADAAEASRRLRLLVSREEARTAIAELMHRGAEQAINSDDIRGAAAASKVWAEVTGIVGSGMQINIMHPSIQPVLAQALGVYAMVLEVELPCPEAARVLSALQEAGTVLGAEGEKGLERWLEDRRRSAGALPAEAEVIHD